MVDTLKQAKARIANLELGYDLLAVARTTDQARLALMETQIELMPCTHPRGCVVSSPYIGALASNHCGWCASIARAEAAEKQLAKMRGCIAELERLVPEADMLRQVTECADRSGAGKHDARLADSINKMLPLIPAIRKYRECDNDTNGH